MHSTLLILLKRLRKIAQCTVNIIEKTEKSERASRGGKNTSFTEIRKSKETYCIKHLKTAFLYGLNNKIGDTVRPDDEIVGIIFPCWTRSHIRTGGHKHEATTKLHGEEFLFPINSFLIKIYLMLCIMFVFLFHQ